MQIRMYSLRCTLFGSLYLVFLKLHTTIKTAPWYLQREWQITFTWRLKGVTNMYSSTGLRVVDTPLLSSNWGFQPQWRHVWYIDFLNWPQQERKITTYTLCTSGCYSNTLIILSFISDRDKEFRWAYVIFMSQSNCRYLWLPLSVYVYVCYKHYAGVRVIVHRIIFIVFRHHFFSLHLSDSVKYCPIFWSTHNMSILPFTIFWWLSDMCILFESD